MFNNDIKMVKKRWHKANNNVEIDKINHCSFVYYNDFI